MKDYLTSFSTFPENNNNNSKDNNNAPDTVTKGLLERLVDLQIRGQMETTQTTAGLRSARILRRLEETQTPVEDHQLG